MNRCFLVGHRDAPEEIIHELKQIVKRMIAEEDVKEFIVGHYGKFDYLAAKAVAEVKREHQEVRLTLLTPYHPAEKPLDVNGDYDEILYPFERPVPPKTAIVQANQKAIRMSSHLIAYVCHPGKAREFLEYAQRRKIKIERVMQ